ncbi:unnamed protein product [Cylindrotheca closterium]|uniref:Nucleoporin Nup54 alpha-helical domain-containing protein n=1 Tax=Cylindrotheca closterium TaxID=2856 RepID=A0AAD2CFP9_9STRA|nr:unnamed protein product [Cylindrotheca closterium]
MAVTWGQNQTHVFGTPAPGGTPGSAPGGTPQPSAFGAPSPGPAPGGLFGASTPAPSGGLFGAPSPAPTGGSLFGAPSTGSLFGNTAPSPAPGGSMFGSTTPAPGPGTSLFGSSSTGTSLFGAPAPSSSGSLFGSSAPSGFYGSNSNAANTAQPPQPQIPAQAALQAHLNASAQQEADRVRSKLESLHRAYTSGSTATVTAGNNPFVAIVYNDLTPEQRQMQWVQGMGSHTNVILEPPKPPQISQEEWSKAVVNNPDPHNYMPIPLVGGVALQARVSWQQDRAKELSKNASILHKSHETVQQRVSQTLQQLNQKIASHKELQHQLLQMMKKVEVVRCMNQPLQPDEFQVMQRLQQVMQNLEQVQRVMVAIQDKARAHQETQRSINRTANSTAKQGLPPTEKLLPVLQKQRQQLETLTTLAGKDKRDVELIGTRAALTVPSVGY